MNHPVLASGFGTSLFCLAYPDYKLILIVISFIVAGFAQGGFGVFIQFVAERFSAEDYTTAFGMNNLLVMGLACIPGPFIGGWLVDVFSTRGNCESDNCVEEEPYWVGFIFGVVSISLSVVVSFFIKNKK